MAFFAGTDDECEDVTRRFEGHPGLSAKWFAFPLAPDVRCSAALFEQRARAPSVAFGATPREVVSPRRFEKKRLFREIFFTKKRGLQSRRAVRGERKRSPEHRASIVFVSIVFVT